MDNSSFVETQARLRAFFNSGATLLVDFRQKALRSLKKAVSDNEDALHAALYTDLRKSAYESYLTEIGLVHKEIDTAIKNLSKWSKAKKASGTPALFPAKSFIIPEPLGLALIIAPWNYPFLLTMAPLVGAVAAGCCCVIKPSEFAPATAAVIEKIIKSSLEDICAVSQGGKEVSTELLKLKWDHIFFTGSTAVGKVVMKIAAENLTTVTLELGGKSPVIVCEDAKIKLAARRIAWGKIINAGQTCIAPDYLFVHETIAGEFIAELAAAIKEMTGDPLSSSDYPKIISERHFDRLTGYLKDIELIYGGQSSRETLTIAPALVKMPGWCHPLANEEIFGPILPIRIFKNISEPLDYIKGHPKPLAFYLFTENKQTQNKILTQLSFGGGCVNDTLIHIAAGGVPFGGVGASGMGQYHGKYGFDTFSHYKSIVRRGTWMELNLRFPPFKGKNLSWLKRFMR